MDGNTPQKMYARRRWWAPPRYMWGYRIRKPLWWRILTLTWAVGTVPIVLWAAFAYARFKHRRALRLNQPLRVNGVWRMPADVGMGPLATPKQPMTVAPAQMPKGPPPPGTLAALLAEQTHDPLR